MFIVTPEGIAIAIVGMIIAAVQIVKESRITAAENAERGRLRVIQEQKDIAAAEAWLPAVCPDCKTKDGRRCHADGAIQLIQDGMDVRYNYCSDIWHSAAHKGSGTYRGRTSAEALLKIGQDLRRKQ